MPKLMDSQNDELVFPIGIAYVSAAMKRQGYNVYCLNLNLIESKEFYYEIQKNILENNIDIVLTGALSAHYNLISHLVNDVKKIKPTVQIIVGGGLISGDPDTAMQALENVDYGLFGEGEVTSCQLAQYLESGGDIQEIKGLIYRTPSGDIIKNLPREDIDDLNGLPFPDYDGFNYKKHVEITHQNVGERKVTMTKAFNISYIVASRSCPYQCTFCFHTCGKKYRQRSLDSVFEEIEYIITTYGVKFISIMDELFSNDKERVKEFCSRIKQYNISWWAQFRLNNMDEELVRIIKDANCAFVGLGLESADDTILKSMKKHLTLSQIEEGLEILLQEGMPFVANLIFGDKAETQKTARSSLAWWQKNQKYDIRLGYIITFPGSELYKYAIEKGIIADPVQFLKLGCPQINVSSMSDEEFGEISEEIASYRVEQLLAFKKFKFSDRSLIATCQNCKKESTYNGVSFFSNGRVFCPNCGRPHSTPLPKELIIHVKSQIESIVLKNQEVAIWCINSNVIALYNELDERVKRKVVLIDSSIAKQSYKHISVCAPEIIESRQIPVVVVGIESYGMIVENEIRNRFKNVRKIIKIQELIEGEKEDSEC